MSQQPISIPKMPVLRAAEDFYRLRREGIGFIEKIGSHHWTDYNLHDPGITILEALCYAITDLAYRTGWDIKDLLAQAIPSSDPKQPFPHQAFFTAAQILTVNPWTPDDFRRLLINRNTVRNAWMFCKDCACDLHYLAWCDLDKLYLGYQLPAVPSKSYLKGREKKVAPTGLYEALLELENDPTSGDLNDRKIEQTILIKGDDKKQHALKVEMRFPAFDLLDQEQFSAFIAFNNTIPEFNRTITNIQWTKFSPNKNAQFTNIKFIEEKDLLRGWKGVFYTSFDITFDVGPNLKIENVAVRLFGDEDTKKLLKVQEPIGILTDYKITLESIFCKKTAPGEPVTGFVQPYRWKLKKIEDAVVDAKSALHAHRNLDEDYCRIKRVEVEDMAVCADVEVTPDADIERIQAQIWFEVEMYFNPPVPFYSLQEMQAAGEAVEDIFEGPALENGFIKSKELEAARLKTELRVSDIINKLMDIPGVVSVNNLMLTKYDAEGNPVNGDADQHPPKPLVPNPNQISARWTMAVTPLHQPRLYHNLSRFLFFKNGLPFTPRMDESLDTLTQLRGAAERPKFKNTEKDLPVPSGTYRNPTDYYPVQYSLPMTYGVGLEGIPNNPNALRQAKAKQLKAYLMVFEQILVNANAQIAHVADLFSLDKTIGQTYFVQLIDEALIKGSNDLFNGLTQEHLQNRVETQVEFRERRNRFLDHLLARFGEQFNEYALLLSNLNGEALAEQQLIVNKINFLKIYATSSHDRAKAFNYCINPTSKTNVPGLRPRLHRLLGYPVSRLDWVSATGPAGGPFTFVYQLFDEYEVLRFGGTVTAPAPDIDQARKRAFKIISDRMQHTAAYKIIQVTVNQYRVDLMAGDGITVLGSTTGFQLLTTAIEAVEFVDVLTELAPFSEQGDFGKPFIIIEHLLLRPKFPGDALFPACSEGGCQNCGCQDCTSSDCSCDDIRGDEDPYSFRLTYVMAGWAEPFNNNLGMRRFADRTIQEQTPSHLLPKICWIGNNDFDSNQCNPTYEKLAEIIENDNTVFRTCETAHTCADAVLTKYEAFFDPFFEQHKTKIWRKETWKAAVKKEIIDKVPLTELICNGDLKPASKDEIVERLWTDLTEIAVEGRQFDRFEAARQDWLEANKSFDWTEERLQERLEALLADSLNPDATLPKSLTGDLCRCAANILNTYGTAYYNWLQAAIEKGTALEDLTDMPDPLVNLKLCEGLDFAHSTNVRIANFLRKKYASYITVSYHLWVLLDLLGKLRNVYPGATLHDCDDGSDQNPVRLGSTALGNFPRKPRPKPIVAVTPMLSSVTRKKKLLASPSPVTRKPATPKSKSSKRPPE